MRKQVPKILQVASYFLNLEPSHTSLTVSEVHYAMFLYDIRHRYMNERFPFSSEEKRISLHGVIYQNLKVLIGSSPNRRIRYKESGLAGLYYLLSEEEMRDIELFHKSVQNKLFDSHYSREGLLNAIDIPVTQDIISNLWMEHFFVVSMESKGIKIKTH